MQQQQQQQQQLQAQANSSKLKEFYKKYYSRNPSEILIFENNSNNSVSIEPSTTTTSKVIDIDDSTQYDGDEILDDSDELFFYDHDNDYDYDEKIVTMKPLSSNSNNRTQHLSASILEQSSPSKSNGTEVIKQQYNHIYTKKPPPIPTSMPNKMIYKSAYFTNVLSKNRSNSCENHESLLNDSTKTTSKTTEFSPITPIISNNHSNSASQLNNNSLDSTNGSINQNDSTIRAGIVDDLRKKFNSGDTIDISAIKIKKESKKGRNKSAKLSESSDLSSYSHASIKIEKINDESSELKILQPVILNTETKKVPPSTISKSSINKNRLKSIERTLSTSAHIDDAYKLVKQSLIELRKDDKYIENAFFQIHDKLQDVANFLLSSSSSATITNHLLDDSLNTTCGLLSQQHNTLNNIYEQTFNENLNIIHNNLAFSKYLNLNNDNRQKNNTSNDLYIIENSLNKKKTGHMPRQQTFSPGDYRMKHYF